MQIENKITSVMMETLGSLNTYFTCWLLAASKNIITSVMTSHSQIYASEAEITSTSLYCNIPKHTRNGFKFNKWSFTIKDHTWGAVVHGDCYITGIHCLSCRIQIVTNQII